MSLFDLKPLSQTTIEQLGLEAQDLWLLKIGDQQFGPFETLSLQHYAFENKSDFDGAFAHKMDHESWVYFQNIEDFKSIFKTEVESQEEEDKGRWFWILVQGRMSPPHSFDDIEKKIELGLLSLTDAVSTDEGETWHKIFDIEDFSHKLHSGKELPQCPREEEFQAARILVMEKIESHKMENMKQENVSGLAFLGQKTTQIVVLKIDEIDIESLQQSEVARSLKWAIPTGAACMFALVMSGYVFFGAPSEDVVINDSDLILRRAITGSAPDLGPNRERRPSSNNNYRSRRSGLTNNSYQESSYPTIIETHQGDDPQNEPAFDDQPREPQTEESILNASADQSLDAAMNGVVQPSPEPVLEQPQVEQISDF
jgi:hypothetical protein